MLAAVHSATAVPIGAPLNRSSHRPSGRPIHTGHISVRSNCQHRKKSRPSGGSAGELAITGSISGSADATITLATGTNRIRHSDGGSPRRGLARFMADRTSVLEGKRVSVRVDLGVRLLIKKKNT